MLCTRIWFNGDFITVFFILLWTQLFSFFFFFNDTATTEIYTLSLHDALPIFPPIDCLGRGESGGSAFVPMAILPLQGEQPCAPALRGDSGTLRCNIVLRCFCQVAHDLPADRRIRVQQPARDLYSLLPLPGEYALPATAHQCRPLPPQIPPPPTP